MEMLKDQYMSWYTNTCIGIHHLNTIDQLTMLHWIPSDVVMMFMCNYYLHCACMKDCYNLHVAI